MPHQNNDDQSSITSGDENLHDEVLVDDVESVLTEELGDSGYQLSGGEEDDKLGEFFKEDIDDHQGNNLDLWEGGMLPA
eukprot:4259280-Ditylum_brightwellii.AAC.1